jgi:hypothetical protein
MDDSEGAIYVPPKDGLPYLVVTYAEGSWKAQPTSTRSEARVLLARRTRRSKLAAHVAAEPVRLAK